MIPYAFQINVSFESNFNLPSVADENDKYVIKDEEAETLADGREWQSRY